jgi:hypothetical protein
MDYGYCEVLTTRQHTQKKQDHQGVFGTDLEWGTKLEVECRVTHVLCQPISPDDVLSDGDINDLVRWKSLFVVKKKYSPALRPAVHHEHDGYETPIHSRAYKPEIHISLLILRSYQKSVPRVPQEPKLRSDESTSPEFRSRDFANARLGNGSMEISLEALQHYSSNPLPTYNERKFALQIITGTLETNQHSPQKTMLSIHIAEITGKAHNSSALCTWNPPAGSDQQFFAS